MSQFVHNIRMMSYASKLTQNIFPYIILFQHFSKFEF